MTNITKKEIKEQIWAWTQLLTPEKGWRLDDPKKTQKEVIKGLLEVFFQALSESFEAGKNYTDTEMRKAMEEWHKREKTGLEENQEPTDILSSKEQPPYWEDKQSGAGKGNRAT